MKKKEKMGGKLQCNSDKRPEEAFRLGGKKGGEQSRNWTDRKKKSHQGRKIKERTGGPKKKRKMLEPKNQKKRRGLSRVQRKTQEKFLCSDKRNKSRKKDRILDAPNHVHKRQRPEKRTLDPKKKKSG